MWQSFSRMRLKWYFFEIVFQPYFLGFFREIQNNFKIGKVRKSDDETEYFEKKNNLIFIKGMFNNVGGRKISRR